MIAMQRLPVIAGMIKRRMLINFRADPAVVAPLLPSGMSPKLHQGHAIVGICLIRLEQIRPKAFPAFLGMASENAAHRIAVEWEDADGSAAEGVYIPRRDTDSAINALAGGRIFPGEHHLSKFDVEDDGKEIRFAMKSSDQVEIRVGAKQEIGWPSTSCFGSMQESSEFYQRGGVGYSITRETCRLDGVRLLTEKWEVAQLQVYEVYSSYYHDLNRFPKGTIVFDHALIMRDIPHEWHSVPDYQAALPVC